MTKNYYKPGLTGFKKLMIFIIIIAAIYFAGAIGASSLEIEPVATQWWNWISAVAIWIWNSILKPAADWITGKIGG